MLKNKIYTGSIIDLLMTLEALEIPFNAKHQSIEIIHPEIEMQLETQTNDTN